MRADDLAMLRCPNCAATLVLHAEPVGGFVGAGRLECTPCRRRWPIRAGLPDFVDRRVFEPTERVLTWIYDRFAPLHDPVCRYVVPVLQGRCEAPTRNGYLDEMNLEALARHPRSRPVRILEVGIGTGVNYALIRRRLRGVPLEYWGLDVSSGMIRICRRRHGPSVRLVLGDAHALPFADGCFDRAFHVGAIGAFRAPATAMAELARVAAPQTPIVVVDEQLAAGSNVLQRAAFRALTFYEREAASPWRALPYGASAVRETQISPFFYCLRFEMPTASDGAPRRSGVTSGPVPA